MHYVFDNTSVFVNVPILLASYVVVKRFVKKIFCLEIQGFQAIGLIAKEGASQKKAISGRTNGQEILVVEGVISEKISDDIE